MQHVPNILTLLRILMIPGVYLAFFVPGIWGDLLALLVFSIAGFTDFLTAGWRANLTCSRASDACLTRLPIS